MDTYRVLKRQTFHFDTLSRTSGDINNPSFGFRKDIFQVADSQISLRFSLLQATIPYTWYNISDGSGGSYANNWLDFLEDSNPAVRISIPKGNYNIAQINGLIKTQLNTISTKAFNFQFDPVTLKTTWTYSSAGTVAFQFSPLGSESLDIILGFKATPTQTLYPFIANSLTSENPVNVSQSSDVFINLNNIQGISYDYLNGIFTNSPLFCILPINVPFFGNITYIARRESEFQFIVPSQAMPDSFQFSVTNQYNELLALNRDWDMTLICEWITPEPKAMSEYHLLEKLLLTTYKIAKDMEEIKKIPKTGNKYIGIK